MWHLGQVPRGMESRSTGCNLRRRPHGHGNETGGLGTRKLWKAEEFRQIYGRTFTPQALNWHISRPDSNNNKIWLHRVTITKGMMCTSVSTLLLLFYFSNFLQFLTELRHVPEYQSSRLFGFLSIFMPNCPPLGVKWFFFHNQHCGLFWINDIYLIWFLLYVSHEKNSLQFLHLSI